MRCSKKNDGNFWTNPMSVPYSVSLDNALAAMMICHFVISPGLASHQSQVCAASSFNVNTSLQLISVNYGGDSLTAVTALLKSQSGGSCWPAARLGNPFHNTLSFSPLFHFYLSLAVWSLKYAQHWKPKSWGRWYTRYMIFVACRRFQLNWYCSCD